MQWDNSELFMKESKPVKATDILLSESRRNNFMGTMSFVMITFEANLRKQNPCGAKVWPRTPLLRSFSLFSIRKQEPLLCKEKDVEIENFYTGENH